MRSPAELRAELLEDLAGYRGLWPEEAPVVDRMAAFLQGQEEAFSRSCGDGHVTGSAFVVDPARARGLFVHHAKLGRWLQPGGHCEAGEGALEAARRETFEETGVEVGDALSELPFDIDIHEIPERGSEARHFHFDVRFLFIAKPGELRASHESLEIAWLTFAEARLRNPEMAIRRPLDKIEAGREKKPQAEEGRITGSKDPLHGMTLERILTLLVEGYGWAGLAERIPLQCFTKDPSIKSSLIFLRRTPWARAKVEALYLGRLRPRRKPLRKPVGRKPGT
jgi:8-oxo-dGTP pyrophosphatase MutT (NUDIX family)